MTRSTCTGSHHSTPATACPATSTSGSSSHTKLHTACQAPRQHAKSERCPVSSTMLRGNEIMKDLQDVLLVRGRRSDTSHMLTSPQIGCYHLCAKPEYHSEVSFHQHLWHLPTENHSHHAASRGDEERLHTSPRSFSLA